MAQLFKKNVAIIVAHPDDETLWAGGTILSHPSWNCFVVCMSRRNDEDRAPKFNNALKVLKSDGIMGNLDDGPGQLQLDEKDVQCAILELLPKKQYDLIITHNPNGEYTKHIRHEEVSKAVILLWHKGEISTNELWTFAYEDGNKEYYPKPIETASIYRKLMNRIWLRKYSIITETYGFDKDSWEAQSTTQSEAFWKFTDPYQSQRWLKQWAH
jgi:LmbE family N-acetylglucosaminyl deacetylase